MDYGLSHLICQGPVEVAGAIGESHPGSLVIALAELVATR